MAHRSFLLTAAAATAFLCAPVSAQETDPLKAIGDSVDTTAPLVIIADDMSYDTDGSVARAQGNAEAYHGSRVLTADTLEYYEEAGRLRAQGGVAVRNDDGSYLFADEAELSADLSEGAIAAPKALIAGGGKLAAAEGRRVGGRYNVLSKAVYSPCDVCQADPEPLWQVKAGKVIHDQGTRDIIYEDASFEIEGVPVAYLPYFRHPDPSVRRRSGLLPFKFGSDSAYGYSVKAPYFLELSHDRDLTITPFVTTEDGLLLEGEYRALTETGGYRLWGSFTRNNRRGEGDEFRGAARGTGRFLLTDETGWGFDLNLASDDTFLRRYDYSDEDRVTSRLFLDRQNERLFAEANAFYFQSFLPDEPSSTLPIALPELRLRYRALEDPIWGIATAKASALRLQRDVGRDVTRVSAGADWERQFLTPQGLVLTPFAGMRADAYLVEDDPAIDDDLRGRADAFAGVDLRMPFIMENDLGTHILEPVVQAVVAPNQGNSEFPNEDSLDLTFDETILFTGESRFAGIDRIEGGARLNAGVRYDFQAENGFGIEAAYGRVFRVRDNSAFTSTSGLRNAESDHVGVLRLKLDPYFDITNRLRVNNENYDVERNEIYARGTYGPIAVAGSYAFLAADPQAGFATAREEIAGKAILRVKENWTLYGGARRDLEDSRMVESEGGLRYEDECLYIDFSIGKRSNDDRDAEDGTRFGLTLRLKSLGA